MQNCETTERKDFQILALATQLVHIQPTARTAGSLHLRYLQVSWGFVHAQVRWIE